MATQISTAFIKQFESEVHMAYQRMGSKLKNTVRQSNNVQGSQARFKKWGQVLRLQNLDMVMYQQWKYHIQLSMLHLVTSMLPIW
jgi:hypothetical protein